MQPIDPVTREFTTTDFETGQRLAYSLDTGNTLRSSRPHVPEFQYYSGREGLPAYGNLYVAGYGGVLYCYSMTNGELLWTYGNGGEGNSTNTGLNTPWGNYPTHIAGFANGIVYTMSGEHSPNTPLYQGYRARAINASTGAETLDTILTGPHQDSEHPTHQSPSQTDTWYSPMHTTAKSTQQAKAQAKQQYSIQNNVIQQGNSVLIQGTVMDISAGTTQEEQAARFPDGVPAVSEESQTAWMEYVYEQQPLPTNASGVTVTLSVVDANGNYRAIGTTSTAGRLLHIQLAARHRRKIHRLRFLRRQQLILSIKRRYLIHGLTQHHQHQYQLIPSHNLSQ